MPEQLATNRFTDPPKLLIIQAALFVITLALGLVSGQKIIGLYSQNFFPPKPTMSLEQLLATFAAATVLFLLVPKFFKQSAKVAGILKALFVLMAYFSGVLVLSLWLSAGFLASLVMLVLLLWWLKFFNALIHNLVIILAIAGAGTILGLTIDPLVAVIFLIFLAVYDYIAVYQTKHMVAMARTMIESRAVFGFLVSSKLDDWLAILKPDAPLTERFVILGSGDVALPLLLAVSLLPEGLVSSIMVAAFSLLGLFASFVLFITQKIKRPMPALPPIALGALIGYLISQFIT